MSILDFRTRILNQESSIAELTEKHLEKAKAVKKLNAFTEITEDKARKMAEQADSMLRSGESQDYPLLGIPIAVKDLFCTYDDHSQAGSKILEGFRPKYESFVTEKLWKAGAILIGKTNMDEFAMGSSNETSCYGPAVSNIKENLSPGGSSGGSAIAVSAGITPVALGSDTGGSIRQPAAFTGIAGLKPTYGRCSRWGMIAFASSLDQAGPMAKTIEDVAITQDIISGYDPRDATSLNVKPTECFERLESSIKGMKIGIPKEYKTPEISESVLKHWETSIERLREAGAKIQEVSLPHTEYALPAYYILAPAEASSNLARYDGIRYGKRISKKFENLKDFYETHRSEGFGTEVKRRILIGTYVLSQGYYEAYYLKAQQVRKLIQKDFETCFKSGIQAILTPTTPKPAFEIGAKFSPVEMYSQDIFTVPANLAGLPAVSVPVGFSDENLPIGMQIVGKEWQEGKILTIAKKLEI